MYILFRWISQGLQLIFSVLQLALNPSELVLLHGEHSELFLEFPTSAAVQKRNMFIISLISIKCGKTTMQGGQNYKEKTHLPLDYNHSKKEREREKEMIHLFGDSLNNKEKKRKKVVVVIKYAHLSAVPQQIWRKKERKEKRGKKWENLWLCAPVDTELMFLKIFSV